MSTNETQQPNTTICPKHQIERTTKKLGIPPFEVTLYFCSLCDKETEERHKKEELDFNERLKKHHAEMEIKRINNGIPSRYKNAKLSDFQNISVIEKWCDDPKDFILIFGNCGTGKSHLSAAIAYNLRHKKLDCGFAIASQIFLELRNSFNKKGEEENEFSIINKYAKKKIAVFDDIGTQKMSDYTLEAWYNIIDYRYGEQLPTIFTSNMSLKELSICMTDRIASRLASGIIFELKGIDKRLGH